MKYVYLDNVATTKIDTRIVEGLNKLLDNSFYNVDALYPPATELKSLMEQSRSILANTFKVKPNEIIFTSGASEANNMIIKGVIEGSNKKHLITTRVEHSSVSSIFDYYQSIGYQVDYLEVDRSGKIDLNQLKSLLSSDTLLVSVMAVNNEIGTIFDIKGISEIIRKNSIAFFHSDMTQALAKTSIDLAWVDGASFSAHKIGGLKGSGFAYIRHGVNIVPLIMGGQQEFGLRGGSSNAPYNILLAKTVRIALENYENNRDKIRELAEYVKKELLKIEKVKINSVNSVDSIINIDLGNIGSQVALNAFFNEGVLLSGHSTCSSKKIQYSKILKNMGFSLEKAQSSVRISLSYNTTKSELDYFVNVLKKIKEKYVI